MAEAPGKPDLSDIPEALPAPQGRWAPSLVWLIPIVAAVIGGWIAVQAIMQRGPTITITFATAEGIEAGKTRIKYKNVDIGEVTGIALSVDRNRVVVTAQLDRRAENLLVDDTRFWVVRPRIAASGVSGLGTLLSGSYIGVDVGKSAEERRHFSGLDTPPVVTADLPGRQFALRGDDLGSLDIGSPVYFRRIQVGQVVAFNLDRDGKGVTLQVFVNAPYDQYVTTETRFWHASGVDVTLDASGVRVDTESLASIVVGGIAFQAPPDALATTPAKSGSSFTLFADRTTAMKLPDTVSENYVLVFNESVRGLTPGAPVDFRGVVIGEVTGIGVDFDPVKHSFRMPVEIRLYPERLRSRYRKAVNGGNPVDSRSLLDALVEGGLRAQLRTGNLLTGQLYVALDLFPNAPKAKVDWSKQPLELPTVPGSLEELQLALAQIVTKLDKVPFDAIAADLRQTLQTLNRTMHDTDKLVQRLDTEVTPEARATLEDARRTLGSAERTLSSDAPLQQDLRGTLRELSRAAVSLRALADYLERHPESLIRGKKEDGQ